MRTTILTMMIGAFVVAIGWLTQSTAEAQAPATTLVTAHRNALKADTPTTALSILKSAGIESALDTPPPGLSTVQYAHLLNDYGYFLDRVGSAEAAIPVLEKVLVLVPERTVVRLNLADALRHTLPGIPVGDVRTETVQRIADSYRAYETAKGKLTKNGTAFLKHEKAMTEALDICQYVADLAGDYQMIPFDDIRRASTYHPDYGTLEFATTGWPDGRTFLVAYMTDAMPLYVEQLEDGKRTNACHFRMLPFKHTLTQGRDDPVCRKINACQGTSPSPIRLREHPDDWTKPDGWTWPLPLQYVRIDLNNDGIEDQIGTISRGCAAYSLIFMDGAPERIKPLNDALARFMGNVSCAMEYTPLVVDGRTYMHGMSDMGSHTATAPFRAGHQTYEITDDSLALKCSWRVARRFEATIEPNRMYFPPSGRGYDDWCTKPQP